MGRWERDILFFPMALGVEIGPIGMMLRGRLLSCLVILLRSRDGYQVSGISEEVVYGGGGWQKVSSQGSRFPGWMGRFGFCLT